MGFEPTPLRTGALSQRLRPLGQTVLLVRPFCCMGEKIGERSELGPSPTCPVCAAKLDVVGACFAHDHCPLRSTANWSPDSTAASDVGLGELWHCLFPVHI